VRKSLEDEFGGLMWALAIDGKDAKLGPHAYDHCGFRLFLAQYTFALGEAGHNELSTEFILELVHRAGWDRQREYRVRKGDGHFGLIPLNDHIPTCYEVMSCEARADVLATIPAEVLQIYNESNIKAVRHRIGSLFSQGDPCPIWFPTPRVDVAYNISSTLRLLVANYTHSLRKQDSMNSEARILILANFLRSFAWMHPFADGNGRLRTIILQRELRRLGLGRGAFMYNNNRDVYFINDKTYAAKIREGIRMADIGMRTKVNPWLDAANVEKHLSDFPTPFTRPGACVDKIRWAFPEADVWST